VLIQNRGSLDTGEVLKQGKRGAFVRGSAKNDKGKIVNK